MKIDLTAFDLFGVLFSEGHLISNVLMQLLPTKTDKSLVKEQYEHYNQGRIKEAEFWAATGVTDIQGVRDRFLGHFVTDYDYAMVVEQLGQRFRLAILSNLPADWAEALTAKFEFKKLFSPCLFSGQVQCKKPEHAIYRLLQQQTGVPFERMLFVDDRLENLQSAHELGMTTVYFHRDDETHGYLPDFTIGRLRELAEVLTDRVWNRFD